MATRNKYAKRSRISEAMIREVVRYVAVRMCRSSGIGLVMTS